MKYRLLIAFFLFNIYQGQAQSTKEIIAKVNQKFGKVKDYSADISLNFRIPGINMEEISGKVFYKSPNKFRVKTKGIAFLPKQNPYYSLAMLKDTNSFVAISNGIEKIGSVYCNVISIIPNKESDLILGKFWIDHSRGLVMKSQLTTKSNGTISIDNSYGNMESVALPSKMIFTVDMTKFKVPKAVAVDINSKVKKGSSEPQKSTGQIELNFNNYLINKQIKDNVFVEK